MMACPASMAMTLPLTTEPSSGVSISRFSFRRASNSSMDAFWAMWRVCPLQLHFSGRAVVSAGLWGVSLVGRVTKQRGPGVPTLLALSALWRFRLVDEGRDSGRAGVNQAARWPRAPCEERFQGNLQQALSNRVAT